MNSNQKYFKLFANCIAVKGARRAIICDLQRGFYVEISNDSYNILNELKNKRIKDVSSNYDYNSFHEFISKLITNELGFYCDNPKRFPELDTSYLTPYVIEDCIIELSIFTLKNYKKIINSLNILGCQTIELRCYNHINLNLVSKFISYLSNSRVKSVELYLKYSEAVSIEEYRLFLESYSIISYFVLHSYPFEINNIDNDRLAFSKQNISSASCCGKINKNLFRINLPFYLESQNKNNCLNRKISITENGDIKNCPSLENSYGNIVNTKMEDVVKKKTFTDIWNVRKDEINVCKDCEFRYICSDCRAYVSGKFDKPLNCNYDPYSN